MSPSDGSRSSRFALAAAWSFVMEGGRQGAALVISLLLAAMLGPDAFGLSAMAFVLVGLLDHIQRQGLSAAIVQRPDLTDRHVNAAFWMQLGASIPVTLVSISVAGWWAGVNDEPELKYVIWGLTPLLLLGALTAVPEAMLLREQQMRVLALRSGVSVVVGGVAGIVAAFAGMGVWALVIQQLLTATVALMMLWSVSTWRPNWSFSPSAARELLGFSTGIFVGVMGHYLGSRADVIVMGIYVNAATVGLYRLAARLVESALSIASQPMNILALPALSESHDNVVERKLTWARLTRISSAATVPTMAILAGCAVPVTALLGQEWLPAAGALQWLALSGAIVALTVANGPMLESLGRPHLNAALSWLVTGVSFGFFLVVGAALPSRDWPEAAAAMAAARSLSMLALLPVVHLVFLRVAGISIVYSMRIWLPSLWAAALAGMGSWTVSSWIYSSFGSPLLALAIGGLVGLIGGVAGLGLDRDLRRIALGFLYKNRQT